MENGELCGRAESEAPPKRAALVLKPISACSYARYGGGGSSATNDACCCGSSVTRFGEKGSS